MLLRSTQLAFAILIGPAAAQTAPASDCKGASSAVEQAICATPDLAVADRQMVEAYDTLAGKLGGPAREHLLMDQQHWLALRDEACVGGRDEVAGCVTQRDELRLENLKALGEGGYPFVSEQALVKSGTVGKISYSIDATWPRFDGSAADFSVINREYAATTAKTAQEVIPADVSAGELRGEQEWSYSQSFELQRPSANAVAVAVNYDGFAGGAHGFSGTDARLVDLRTGRAAGPAEVFAPGGRWLEVLVPIVRSDLKKQFADGKDGFDDAIEPDRLAKLLGEPGHYYWQRDGLQLIFNAYVVGPYVSGQFTVDVPYTTLRPLFAKDGPLGD